MSRRGLFQVLAMAVFTVCMLVFSGVASAQGRSDQAFERVKEVQERHTEKLMAKQGVVGTAVGRRRSRRTCRPGPVGESGRSGDTGGAGRRAGASPGDRSDPRPGEANRPPGQDKKSPKPPAAPTTLSATAGSSSRIDLSWIDNAGNETGFKIERWTAEGFAQIAMVGANVRTYSDGGLNPSTPYTYRVRAYNSAGDSAYSNAASATTLGSVETPIGPRPAPIGVSTGHPIITAGTIGCRVTKARAASTPSATTTSMPMRTRLPSATTCCSRDPSTAARTHATRSAHWPIFSRSSSPPLPATRSMRRLPCARWRHLATARRPAAMALRAKPLRPRSSVRAVKKHGRTTGLTHGEVVAVNATVNVGYSTGSARFVKQIIISPGSFSDGGDSGSLIVTESGNNPVGLLFAGSDLYTIANPDQPRTEPIWRKQSTASDPGEPSRRSIAGRFKRGWDATSHGAGA